MYNSFNEKSLRVINNIYNNLLSHPLFSNCQIERINDFGNGTVQLDMYLNGNFYNKYMFCPDPAGNIESVAIYGASLMEHLRKIEASMKFCDIDVLEVSIDNGGYSPYVDAILGTNYTSIWILLFGLPLLWLALSCYLSQVEPCLHYQ